MVLQHIQAQVPTVQTFSLTTRELQFLGTDNTVGQE